MAVMSRWLAVAGVEAGGGVAEVGWDAGGDARRCGEDAAFAGFSELSWQRSLPGA